MANPKILIVEDERAISEVLEYNLAKEGYDVELEYRGDTALDRIRTDPPDLILLDLMLPGLDGLEICRIIKRDQRTASVPLIVLTAKGEEVDRVVGLELGADDYITKPFSPREVVLRIKAVLRRADTQEPDVVEAIEANLQSRPSSERQGSGNRESCISWDAVWNGTSAPPRGEVREALAMFKYRPVPKGS